MTLEGSDVEEEIADGVSEKFDDDGSQTSQKAGRNSQKYHETAVA